MSADAEDEKVDLDDIEGFLSSLAAEAPAPAPQSDGAVKREAPPAVAQDDGEDAVDRPAKKQRALAPGALVAGSVAVAAAAPQVIERAPVVAPLTRPSVLPSDAARLAEVREAQWAAAQAANAMAAANTPVVPAAAAVAVKKVANLADPNDKRKVLRASAGEVWEDPTLADWPEGDFRLFVGDLGVEATEDTLIAAFNKYASFAKARVVKDKYSRKPRGYGFVSFLDPNDAAKALREMNGKYVGNRPIKLRKSNWADRSLDNV